MAQVRLRTQVWKEGDALPPPQLSHGAPPVEPQPDAPRPSPRPWAVLAVLWYVCHVALVGAAYVTLVVDAEGYCTSPLQPLVAVPAALALWAVTLCVRHQARKC